MMKVYMYHEGVYVCMYEGAENNISFDDINRMWKKIDNLKNKLEVKI